jgi:hypothetical protein
MASKPGGAVSGTFPSLKLGRPVGYASSVERDFLFFVEFDCTVVQYQEQPFCLTGELSDGSLHRYTPDFLVHRVGTRQLVECKPATACDCPHTQQQCALGEAWAAAHDGTFRLVTDEELRAGHRLANLKRLWRYSRWPIDAQAAATCLAWVQTQPELTVVQLAALQEPDQPHQAMPLIYALLFHHRLRIDLTQALTPDSRIALET